MEEMFAELNQLAREASERYHAAEQMVIRRPESFGRLRGQ
jgi:hypothetical protein